MRILVWWLLTFLLSSGVVSGHVVEYYHLDATGNVRAVTNQQGQVIERHDYLPFGEEWCGTAPCSSVTPGQPKRFTGKERDAETGLDYFGARYYASKIGRFTTVDPVVNIQGAIFNPQKWNRYAYSLNNPLRYFDPDGQEEVTIIYRTFIPDAATTAFGATFAGASAPRQMRAHGPPSVWYWRRTRPYGRVIRLSARPPEPGKPGGLTGAAT